ncbi:MULTISPECIES: hypothetical protein [unclassified Moraxella]
MTLAILIYCLAYILEQKANDEFNKKLLSLRCQWRYEVSMPNRVF